MKVIKRLNNNSVMCFDSRGRNVVAFGKGIAFALPEGSSELPLSAIERTFYDIDEHYLALFDELSPEILQLAADVIGATAPSLSYDLSPNAALALADHISFAISRLHSGMLVKMPLAYDVFQMYPIESRAGEYALKLISQRLNIKLPRDEATGIALCLVNAALSPAASQDAAAAKLTQKDNLVESVSRIIERRCKVTIDRNSFEFARFATHLFYLLERTTSEVSNNSQFSDVADLYQVARDKSPGEAACLDEINSLIDTQFCGSLSTDEQLYLLMHITRIVRRCNETSA